MSNLSSTRWRRATWKADGQAIAALRYQHLLPDTAKPSFTVPEWSDADDAEALHWVIDGSPGVAACARLVILDDLNGASIAPLYEGFPGPIPSPIGVFGRLVLDPGLRKSDARATIDALRVAEARLRGCRSLLGFTSAGPKRVAQLREIGFRTLFDDQPKACWPFGNVVVLMQELK